MWPVSVIFVGLFDKTQDAIFELWLGSFVVWDVYSITLLVIAGER